MLPGSYIVRIYRRGEDDPRMVVGIVEKVGVREKKGFHCIEELRLILDLPLGQPIRQPRDGGNGAKGKAGEARPNSAGVRDSAAGRGNDGVRRVRRKKGSRGRG